MKRALSTSTRMTDYLRQPRATRDGDPEYFILSAKGLMEKLFLSGVYWGAIQMSDKYELFRFEKDGLILDVNVSPSEDTVWLSLNEMCLLFGRDKSVISRHIKNLFKEGELEPNQTVAKNATIASVLEFTMFYYY